MNPTDPLAQLNPLREPAAIGWWPLAPGWWLLIALLSIVAGVLAWRLIARYRRNAYRRQAITELQAIRKHWESDGNNSLCLTQTNALLKAVALRAFPRRDIASVSGEQWRDFLNSSSGTDGQFEIGTLQAQYQPSADADAADVGAHLDRSDRWCRNHRVTP
ncbi:MAG: DUF4381 domain-containing protein [Halioglobus sp.]